MGNYMSVFKEIKIDPAQNVVLIGGGTSTVSLGGGSSTVSLSGPLATASWTGQAWSGSGVRVLMGPTDLISNLPVFVDYDHHQLHEGEIFRWSVYVSSLGNGSSKDIRLTVPNITIPAGQSPVGLCPHFRFEVVASDSATAQFYEGVTFSGNGNTRTPVPMERNGTYTPKLAIGEDPTVDVLGTTLIWQGLLTGTKSSAGGTDHSVTEFILKNNTSYLFRVTSGGAGNKVLIRFVWYEDLGV